LPVAWQGEAGAGEALPGALFDSVAENLLQNALAKRQRQPGLAISVRFADASLTVADDGSAISPSLSCALFREPVMSEDGLGIGLYHAARQAEASGYLLALSDNQPGAVAFTLAPRP
jgi:C4-dicarboxylate-specific signal transduction histidine kinase